MKRGRTGLKVDAFLADVRKLMAMRLARTALAPLAADCMDFLGNGKMLRARLAWRVGSAAGVRRPTLAAVAAAVEMTHAGSLLHDDVIDGGRIRRRAPTFWVEKGVSGAILLGDLLFFLALDLLQGVSRGRLVAPLVRIAGEICGGESEQELVLRGRRVTWEQCASIARRKTGALFAFTAYASAGRDGKLAEALREAGYALGTAYQLADDVLDATGSSIMAGKTLGSDRVQRKATATSVRIPRGLDVRRHIDDLCARALQRLEPWPRVRAAWEAYMDEDMRAVLNRNLGPRR